MKNNLYNKEEEFNKLSSILDSLIPNYSKDTLNSIKNLYENMNDDSLKNYVLFKKVSFINNEFNLFPIVLYSLNYDKGDLFFFQPNLVLVNKKFVTKFKEVIKYTKLDSNIKKVTNVNSIIKNLEEAGVPRIYCEYVIRNSIDTTEKIFSAELSKLDNLYSYIKSKYVIKGINFDDILNIIENKVIYYFIIMQTHESYKGIFNLYLVEVTGYIDNVKENYKEEILERLNSIYLGYDYFLKNKSSNNMKKIASLMDIYKRKLVYEVLCYFS